MSEYISIRDWGGEGRGRGGKERGVEGRGERGEVEGRGGEGEKKGKGKGGEVRCERCCARAGATLGALPSAPEGLFLRASLSALICRSCSSTLDCIVQ